MNLLYTVYLPVIVHYCNDQRDVVDVLIGNVKDQCLVVDGIQCVFLGGCLPLLQPTAITDQRGFHIRV